MLVTFPKSIMKFLFGYDIFISYSRIDALVYAAGLANELTKLGFWCYLDQFETVPGEDLPTSLRKSIQRSTMLVIVGTEGGIVSVSVAKEVESFLKTKRTIIPINFDGALYKASWYTSIKGLPLSPETKETLIEGAPSQTTISRIEKSFNFTKRNQRMRRLFLGASFVVLCLISISVWAGEKISQQLAELQNQNKMIKQAEDKLKDTESKLYLTQQQKLEAEQQKLQAELEAQKAQRNTKRRIWQEQASLAANNYRFDLAELALVRAYNADPDSFDELLPLYKQARKNRLLVPVFSLALSEQQRVLYWNSWASKPYALIYDYSNNQILLHYKGKTKNLNINCSEEPKIVSNNSVLFLCWQNKLFRIMLRLPNQNSLKVLEFSPEDIAFVDSELRLLERNDTDTTVRILNPTTMLQINSKSLDLLPQTSVIHLSQARDLLAYAVSSERLLFSIHLWYPFMESPKTRQFYISDPQDASSSTSTSINLVKVAPDYSSFFINYSTYNWGQMGMTDPGHRWIEFDINSPRPTRSLDGTIKTLLPIESKGGVKAVYLVRSGDLRMLFEASPIVVDTPIRTISRQVLAFARWNIPPKQVAGIISIVADKEYLTVFSGTNEITRYPVVAVDTAKIFVSQDGDFIAIEGNNSLMVWKKSKSEFVDKLPNFDALSRELSLKWLENESPKYELKSVPISRKLLVK